MVDSSEFAHYFLIRWKIEDDSLSYIDHDYWEGLINQIVESLRVRKVSDRGRDRLFQMAIDRANKPPPDGDSNPNHYSQLSEARRFKLMIAIIWNISAGKDCGRKFYREGEIRMPRDSADKNPRGKDFSDTVCSVPDDTEGFFSFVMETLKAAKEFASCRSQILALRQSSAIDSKKRQSKRTSSSVRKESPSNQKELNLDQVVSISSNRAGHSREKSSSEANNSSSRLEKHIIGDATSCSSNIAGRSVEAGPNIDQLISNSSNRLEYLTGEQSDTDSSASTSTAYDPSERSNEFGEVVKPLAVSSNGFEHLAVEQPEVDRSASMSMASDSSEQSDPLGHSIQSEEVTEPIALAPNNLGHPIGLYHPPLVGIDITGHGSLIIKKAFLHNRKKSLIALGVPLDVVCTQSKDYIVCGLKGWSEGGYVQGQLALDIVGVWFEKSMRQYYCHTLIDFIRELSAGQQLNFGQLYNAAGGFPLVASRSKFDIVPGDAVVATRSQNVSQNSSSHRHLFQITNQNVAGKFIGRGGASTREAEKILRLSISIKQFNGKEYFVCKPCAHQNLDRQEMVNLERCRIGLEIISIWLWEHWNAQNDYIKLLEFLCGLKGSNDQMTLEEIYEAAIHSMRRMRLPYSHKAFFESNYSIEAESEDQKDRF